MTDDTASGEPGGNLGSLTSTTKTAAHTEPAQLDEGVDGKENQEGDAPGSGMDPKIHKPELEKPTNTSDAFIVKEKTTDYSHYFRKGLAKGGYGLEFFMNVVSEHATSKEIYDLWATKLRKYGESFDKPHATERNPRLVRSFMDYVGTVDDRLQKIESKIGLTAKETKKPEDVPGTGHSVQLRFYNASAQPQSRSTSVEDDEKGWNEQSSFLSEVDPKHCLRVLFNWTQDHNAGDDSSRDDDHPDPNRIEISEIRIHSEPITAFLAKQLDYEVHKDSVVRLKRPFRTLIRKTESIKKQLSFLESEYGYAGNTSNPASLEAATHDQPLRSGPSIQPKINDQGSKDVSGKPSFDRKEALDDFRELAAFLDKYLGNEISLYKGYSTGRLRLREIAFENLWMLFDTGELIYCHSQKRDGTLPTVYNGENRKNGSVPLEVHTPQAYRVLATSGGIPATKENRRAGRTTFEQSVYDQMADAEDKSGSVAVSSKRDRYTPFYIDCYFVHFDGSRFSPGQNWLEFKPFEGMVKVQSLLAYPMHYRPVELSETLDLHERGRQFLDLSVVDHRHYDGVTLSGDKEDINSPVIIDYKMGIENNKDWDPEFPWSFMVSWKDEPRQILEIATRQCSHVDCHKSACLEDAYRAHQRDQCEKKMRSLGSQLDELEIPTSRSELGLEKLKSKMAKMGLLDILPGYGLAYVLRGRKWVRVDIMKLGEIRQEEGWDDLVLPQRHKNLVQAMVQTHAAGSRSTSGHSQASLEVDLVRGKGKGCIILLHGEPGVGKTSTAECVALYTKRPLYPITCGDIGTDPREVEQNLEKHFTLAHKWGCVLLLDEADVFLAKRDKFDVARNGLVSVFLRILEYYSGILFLTTNRVGTLDPAFRSRIHVSLYYRKLNKKRALLIWKTNLRRLQKLNEDREQNGLKAVEFDEKSIIKYAEKHLEELKWNGRQIRNAFQTAIALADFEASGSAGKAPTMTKKHFAKLGKAAAEFDEYLESVHGMDEDKMARRDQERATFPRKPAKKKSKRESDSDDSDSSESSDSNSSSDSSSSESTDSDSDDSRAKSKKKKSKSKSNKSKSKDKKKQKQKDKASSGKSNKGGHAKDETTVDED